MLQIHSGVVCENVIHDGVFTPVHRFELLGGNIRWTRSDRGNTTKVWKDCSITGAVVILASFSGFTQLLLTNVCEHTLDG